MESINGGVKVGEVKRLDSFRFEEDVGRLIEVRVFSEFAHGKGTADDGDHDGIEEVVGELVRRRFDLFDHVEEGRVVGRKVGRVLCNDFGTILVEQDAQQVTGS